MRFLTLRDSFEESVGEGVWDSAQYVARPFHSQRVRVEGGAGVSLKEGETQVGGR
jgi:hypothetical protein